MAIVNRQEFADICGKPVAYVNTNIGRNKVALCQGGKMIDTLNPLNKIFIKNAKASTKKEKIKPIKEKIADVYKEVVEPVKEKIYSQTESAEEKEERLEQNRKDKRITDWDERKKIADALKAEKQAEKEAINVEKLLGKLIPFDLAGQVNVITVQNIIRTFENDLINISSIYCDILAGGDRNKQAQITEELRKHLAALSSQAELSAAKELENLVEKYMDFREQRQRDGTN